MSTPTSAAPRTGGLSFEELLQKLRADDGFAWAYLYERFLPRVLAALRSSFGNQTVKEDGIGGEAAISACVSFHRRFVKGQFFDPKDEHQLASLLIRIAFNKCAKKHLWQKRFAAPAGADSTSDRGFGLLESLASHEPTPDEEVFRQLTLGEVREAIRQVQNELRRVDPNYERIFVERVNTDQTMNEIARSVGCSAAKAKRAWRFASDLLRNMLEGSVS